MSSRDGPLSPPSVHTRLVLSGWGVSPTVPEWPTYRSLFLTRRTNPTSGQWRRRSWPSRNSFTPTLSLFPRGSSPRPSPVVCSCHITVQDGPASRRVSTPDVPWGHRYCSIGLSLLGKEVRHFSGSGTLLPVRDAVSSPLRPRRLRLSSLVFFLLRRSVLGPLPTGPSRKVHLPFRLRSHPSPFTYHVFPRSLRAYLFRCGLNLNPHPSPQSSRSVRRV